MKDDILRRYNKLIDLVNYHRNLYHIYDRQEISDEALDSLKKEIFDLEKKYPKILRADSPSQRVSGKPLKGFEKVKHQIRQYSLEDAFSLKDLEDFEKRAKRILEKKNQKLNSDYLIEYKIDGLKIVLEYEKGFLKRALTRGDGIWGEDVTSNVKRIESIPLSLEKPVSIIIEGEIFLRKKVFKQINLNQQKKGEAIFSNPRNIASGTIRQLNPDKVSERNLSAFFYEIAKSDKKFKSNEDELIYLKKIGIPTNPFYRRCQNLSQIEKIASEIFNQKDKLDYLIDGLVIKINQIEMEKELGYTGKAPRFSIAFKFPAVQKTTIMEDCIFQVGRTGAITPIAVLKPIEISGTIVKKASLHNFDEIKRLGIKIGDSVIIEKAGEIIPKIIKVLDELRPENAKKISPPKFLKDCGGDGRVIKEGAILKCLSKNSTSVKASQISFFVSRKCFNIVGLSIERIKKFIALGLISNYADIFYLKKDDLMKIEGFGKKSAENLLAEIEKNSEIFLANFLTALSIDGIGEIYAQKLEDKFQSLDNIKKASLNDFESLDGFGGKIAENIFNWFSERENLLILNRLLKKVKIKSNQKTQKLANLVFAITGKLENYSREQIKKMIIENGGLFSNSLSQKTNYLIASSGENSLKSQKAKKFKTKIINEKSFLNLLK